MAIRLGVDPRRANQMVRGVVTLPHGTGKEVRVLALCTPDKEEEAKSAGADYVGLDEYIERKSKRAGQMWMLSSVRHPLWQKLVLLVVSWVLAG